MFITDGLQSRERDSRSVEGITSHLSFPVSICTNQLHGPFIISPLSHFMQYICRVLLKHISQPATHLYTSLLPLLLPPRSFFRHLLLDLLLIIIIIPLQNLLHFNNRPDSRLKNITLAGTLPITPQTTKKTDKNTRTHHLLRRPPRNRPNSLPFRKIPHSNLIPQHPLRARAHRHNPITKPHHLLHNPRKSHQPLHPPSPINHTFLRRTMDPRAHFPIPIRVFVQCDTADSEDQGVGTGADRVV